jgi:hypothetical protein
MIKNIDRLLKKYTFLFVIVGYLLISLLFNSPIFWGELIHDSSKNSAVIAEIAATEWGMDQAYHRILRFENPFKSLNSILYPFSTDISTSDIGFAYHFLYLRPFLSPHQSLSMLIIINFFLGNICMYALLRKLRIHKLVSFLIGLAFGYMTFMSVRLGHLTYSVYYLFPLFFLSFLNFFSAKDRKWKTIFTISTSFLLVATFLQHIYYFIMLLIALMTLGVYALVVHRKESYKVVWENRGYIALSGGFMFILLIPWFMAVRETMLFSEPPGSIGWGGAVGFSSDLFGFFIPSSYNFYYGKYADFIIQKFDIAFARGIFENFTYPGIFIILGYAYLVVQLFRKKVDIKIWDKMRGYFITSIIFVILTLGPFLHIAGRWALELKDGIKLVVPLPYILLHYVPFLSNIRSPGRFIVPAIFFAYIVVAFLLADILKKKSKKFLYITAVIFISIFIIDHRFPNNKLSTPFYFPKQIYSVIAKDNSDGSVIEIPFTVRDGITYFGDEGALYQIMGQFIYNKPLLGGYVGRVPDYIKNYYKRNAFLGYVGRRIDSNILFNGSIDKKELEDWQVLDIEEAVKTVDFLSLKHIILNTDKLYAATLSGELRELGYKTVMSDKNYSLLERPISNKEFLSISMSRETDSLFIGMGWSATENNSFRWANKRSSALFKVTNPRKLKLEFSAESYLTDNPLKIYLNKKEVGEFIIIPSKKTYLIDIPFLPEKGINTVYFIFDKDYALNDDKTVDARDVSGKFYSIRLVQ